MSAPTSLRVVVADESGGHRHLRVGEANSHFLDVGPDRIRAFVDRAGGDILEHSVSGVKISHAGWVACPGGRPRGEERRHRAGSSTLGHHAAGLAGGSQDDCAGHAAEAAQSGQIHDNVTRLRHWSMYCSDRIFQ